MLVSSLMALLSGQGRYEKKKIYLYYKDSRLLCNRRIFFPKRPLRSPCKRHSLQNWTLIKSQT
jgi:hypothetical protein